MYHWAFQYFVEVLPTLPVSSHVKLKRCDCRFPINTPQFFLHAFPTKWRSYGSFASAVRRIFLRGRTLLHSPMRMGQMKWTHPPGFRRGMTCNTLIRSPNWRFRRCFARQSLRRGLAWRQRHHRTRCVKLTCERGTSPKIRYFSHKLCVTYLFPNPYGRLEPTSLANFWQAEWP